MNILEKIKADLSIFDVLGVSRTEGNILCPLPDHQDNNPSFRVYPSTSCWYCFGCQRGGTVIDLLMHLNRCSLKEAIREGAKRLDVPESDLSEKHLEMSQKHHEREEILGKIMEIGFEYLWNREDLKISRGVRNYLKSRCWSEDILREMRVGLISVIVLQKSGKFTDDQLTLAGLLNAKGDPIFRDKRIIYPILHRNRVVYAVCGQFRKSDEDLRKYVNLCAGPLKIGAKNYLYAHDNLYRKDRLLLCEGISDTLSALTLGFNATGVLGARNLPDPSLFRDTKLVYIVSDNDETGKQAALKNGLAIYKGQSVGARGDTLLVELPVSELVRTENLQQYTLGNSSLEFKMIHPEQEFQDVIINDLNDYLRLGRSPESFAPFLEHATPILIQYVKQLSQRTMSTNDLEDLLDRDVYDPLSRRGLIDQENYIDLLAHMRVDGGLSIPPKTSKRKIKQAASGKRATKSDETESPEYADGNFNETTPVEQIHFIRTRRRISTFETSRRVTDVILSDILGQAKLFHDPKTEQAYLFFTETKNLVDIDLESKELKILLAHYTLNPIESLFKYVVNEIRQKAWKEGESVPIHRFSFYAQDTHTLYVSYKAGEMFKITGDTIDVVDNGTGGVFLQPQENCAPSEISEEEDQDLFERIMLRSINFDYGNLTPVENELLFDLWVRSIAFRSIMPTKPILALIGDGGSGKSLVLRRIYKLLFGPDADIFSIPSDYRDFTVLLANKNLVLFDNVDSPSKWLEDALAIAATGGNVPLRRLYTTKDMIEIPLDAFLALSSREPHFNRPDIAERLLILNLKRIDDGQFIAEKVLLDELFKYRPQLLRALFGRLQEIIRALEYTDKYDPQKFATDFRMADFAAFALRWGTYVKRANEVRAIFTKLQEKQSNFALEGNEIAGLLHIWVDLNEDQERQISSSELYEELNTIAQEEDLPFPIYSKQSFHQHFANAVQSLKSQFEITKIQGRSHKTFYDIRRKAKNFDD